MQLPLPFDDCPDGEAPAGVVVQAGVATAASGPATSLDDED